MASTINFPASQCVEMMIGFSDSNISIILQLASCSPPGLPLASTGPHSSAILPVDALS
jgi:hypothetical protein